MLGNLFNFMRKHEELKSDALESIDQILGEKILNYSFMKYPLSEEKKVNSTLEKMVLSVDTYQAVENDLVAGSQASFNYNKNEINYLTGISQVIKHIKKLPFQEVQGELGEKAANITLFDKFEEKVKEIFRIGNIKEYNEIAEKAEGNPEQIVEEYTKRKEDYKDKKTKEEYLENNEPTTYKEFLAK